MKFVNRTTLSVLKLAWTGREYFRLGAVKPTLVCFTAFMHTTCCSCVFMFGGCGCVALVVSVWLCLCHRAEGSSFRMWKLDGYPGDALYDTVASMVRCVTERAADTRCKFLFHFCKS